MRAFLLATVILALLAGPASAKPSCVAPPGTAAVDEYCETVPTDRGDTGAGNPGSNGPALSGKAVSELSKSGTDGQALAQVLGADPAKVATDAAKSAKGKGHQAGSAVSVPAVAVPDAPSSNPLDAVSKAVGGDSTIGSGFIIAIFVIVLLMAGWGWVAYRRTRPTAS